MHTFFLVMFCIFQLRKKCRVKQITLPCSIFMLFWHLIQTPQRDFIIKISALEIYNEVVRDLLNPDSGPLRLLDDPEVCGAFHVWDSRISLVSNMLLISLYAIQKGTVVEKLVEETANNSQHLRELISICEGTLEKCILMPIGNATMCLLVYWKVKLHWIITQSSLLCLYLGVWKSNIPLGGTFHSQTDISIWHQL